MSAPAITDPVESNKLNVPASGANEYVYEYDGLKEAIANPATILSPEAAERVCPVSTNSKSKLYSTTDVEVVDTLTV